jgi:hypothetical protein
MRVTIIATAFAFASLGVAPASASGVHDNQRRFVADFGAGGRSFDARIRPPASGAIAAAPSVRSEVNYRTAAPGAFADRERMWLWLGSQSDCAMIAKPNAAGSGWLPGCR